MNAPARERAAPLLGRVALLVDRLGNEYTDATLCEVVAAAQERGLSVLCCVGGRLFPEDLTHNSHFTLDFANPKTVDAVLVLPLGGHIGTDDLALFCWRYEPMPICSIAVPWTQFPSVVIDNDSSLREAIRHLITVHRRRRLAFVRGPQRNAEAELRYQVYQGVLAEHSIPFDPRLVAPGSFDVESGASATRMLIEARKASFDALVCSNDAMAFGAIDELRRRGIEIPRDVAVIGFDDTETSRYLEPALTTVRQPIRVQARLALARVLASLEGETGPRQTVLQALTIVRESCGCAGHRPDEADTRVGEAAPRDRSAREIAANLRALHIAGAPDDPWPEALYTAFLDELAGRSSSFLRELDGILRAIAEANGDPGAMQKAITWLGHGAPSSAAPRHVHALLHAARIEVGGAAERVPARRMRRVEELSYALLEANRTLATTVDFDSLGAVLERHLAVLGIPSCFICRHESADRERAQLILAWVDGKRQPLVKGGETFPSPELLPNGFLDSVDPRAHIVLPLDLGEGQSGFVVFEMGPLDAFVYVALVEQISAVFKKIKLLDRLVGEAKAREMAEAERFSREMALAREIQMGVLPRTVQAEGLEVAAAMRPATEVGGDYYDVVPTDDGCWIGIGDVTGHGLPTGLVMLMVQSVVSGLVRKKPRGTPSELLPLVNEVLFENVRRRMDQDEHVTLTLLRYQSGGHLVWAGAHEDILLCRADGRIEWIPTTGTWVAAVADIRAVTKDSAFDLAPGDLMVLYSDGVTEARAPSGEVFGIERLAETVHGMRERTAQEVRDAVLKAVEHWAERREDDVTVLVARQLR